MSQKIDDILTILTETAMPLLAKHDNDLKKLDKKSTITNARLNQLDSKIDKLAEVITDSQKPTDERFRIVEQKLGVFHD